MLAGISEKLYRSARILMCSFFNIPNQHNSFFPILWKFNLCALRLFATSKVLHFRDGIWVEPMSIALMVCMYSLLFFLLTYAV